MAAPALSPASAEAFLCHWEAGEREKKSARWGEGIMNTQWEPLRRIERGTCAHIRLPI